MFQALDVASCMSHPLSGWVDWGQQSSIMDLTLVFVLPAFRVRQALSCTDVQLLFLDLHRTLIFCSKCIIVPADLLIRSPNPASALVCVFLQDTLKVE